MMNLTNLRIGKRLAVGFGIAVVLTLAVAGLGWWSLTAVDSSQDAALAYTENAVRSLAIANSAAYRYLAVWRIATSRDPGAAQEAIADLSAAREDYKVAMADATAHVHSEEGKTLLAEIDAHFGTAVTTNNEVIALANRGKQSEAVDLLTRTGVPEMKSLSEKLDALSKFERQLSQQASDTANSVVARVKWLLSVLVCLVIGLTVVLSVFITRSISHPLGAATAFLAQVSTGDFSRNVQADNLSRKDEVGDLGRSVQAMSENLRKLLREISQGIQTVASSATQLSAASSQTANGVEAMSEKSATVAAAAEESCATTTAVSSSMERASANLTSVAGATEEMSSTVAEIASNSEKARVISEKAMAQAQTISTIMAELGRAAQEIGKVTETITDISAQTNLLALNATIEAARAGTAGKGFAVVANEIKELAKQTSEATEDIKAKIAGVQNSTTGAVQTIETITGVIREIGNTVASTAAAIEEQATVTRNVAGEIAQATAVVREVNDQVAQTASVSRSIASDIASVNSATAGIREGGEQVQSSATELSRLSEQLKVLVAQFSI